MKSIVLTTIFLLLYNSLLLSQAVSINTDATNPDPSAILDVKSTDKGMLVPRMTTAQRTAIAAPATGLLVFDTDTGGFWFYNGTAWTDLSAPKQLADADKDTKIQVEESPDEDIIRFDLGGTERMVLRKNAAGQPRLEFPGFNTFVGTDAGSANTAGLGNTAIGSVALFSNTTGAYNTACGADALRSNNFGYKNTASGADALFSNTSGVNNTASGAGALWSNTTGDGNTASGINALNFNTTGNYNTAAGLTALWSNTTGDRNTALGANALQANTDRSYLVAVGDSALYKNGIGATQSYHATRNTAVGSKALSGNTTGFDNTATGYQALLSNTTGMQNNADGSKALYANTEGFNNTATGNLALFENINGNDNTAAGYRTLFSNTAGSDNTASGLQALYSNTTGSNNTALGASADVAAGNLVNATAIGYDATANANNKVRIGNSSVTVIEGPVDWTFPSDARFKFNICDDRVPGLTFIRKLRPVTYQFDTRKFDEHLLQHLPDSIKQRRMEGRDYRESSARVQTGFLAQEVEKACKDLNFDFSGLHVPLSDVDNYGLAYGSFMPLLVKGIQEQQAIIDTQKDELEKLKKQEAENATLKARVEALQAQLDTQAALLQKISAALQTAGIGVEE